MKRMPGLALGHRGQGMKLQEALRKVIRQFGIGFLQDKRLMSFLSDYKAFDDYPAAADVIKAITTGKFVKELCRKATEEGDDEYLKFADSLKESLVNDSSFKKELADYAVDSVSFALGIRRPGTARREAGEAHRAIRTAFGAMLPTVRMSTAGFSAART